MCQRWWRRSFRLLCSCCCRCCFTGNFMMGVGDDDDGFSSLSFSLFYLLLHTFKAHTTRRGVKNHKLWHFFVFSCRPDSSWKCSSSSSTRETNNGDSDLNHSLLEIIGMKRNSSRMKLPFLQWYFLGFAKKRSGDDDGGQAVERIARLFRRALIKLANEAADHTLY